MKKTIFILCVLLSTIYGNDSSTVKLNPSLYQYGLFFSSDRVTMGGAGAGIGATIRLHEVIDIQPQVHILWGNGNAIATLLSAGYHKRGFWQPGIAAQFGLLWGQRIMVLADDGTLPASPTWITGLRVTPLTFSNSSGLVSVLEFGGGIGADQGMYYELCILSISFCR